MSEGTPIALRILTALSFIALLTTAALQPARAQPVTDEYKVKAAFLFHFAQLVEWPAGMLSAEDQSLSICIYEDEPRRQELENTIEGKLVAGRPFHVKVVSRPQDTHGCSIVFLSRDEAWRQTATLNSLRGLPVLTVGETDNFLADGGMIRFHLDGDKIRFDINTGGADSCHLKISSRLLLLATSVTLADGTNRRR